MFCNIHIFFYNKDTLFLTLAEYQISVICNNRENYTSANYNAIKTILQFSAILSILAPRIRRLTNTFTSICFITCLLIYIYLTLSKLLKLILNVPTFFFFFNDDLTNRKENLVHYKNLLHFKYV